MNINQIYVISLEAGKEEVQQRVLEGLNACDFGSATPYELMQAFDGRSGDIPEGMASYAGWKLEDSWNEWWSRDVLPGEIGCSASHILVWKKIVEAGHERTLILEDDFQANGSVGNIPEPKMLGWDLAYLGRSVIEPSTDEDYIDETWVKPRHSYNSHAYILTLEGAKKLLRKAFLENLIPLDEYLSAKIYPHRRPDIAELFPNDLIAISHVDPYYISQRSNSETSTTEQIIEKPMEAQQDLPYFEILDAQDWEAWKAKYVNPSIAKHEFDLMVDDLGDNIYEFPLFTEKFCREAVALSEALDKWTVDRHEFYPTNDVLLQDIGLQDIYHRVLREMVYPLCIHLWTLEGKGWDNMFSENFLARYTTDRQSHLSLHHDFSHITMVVKLNDEFDGGGTWFPKYNKLSNPERVGTATLHPGMVTHLHGARPIYAGRRYICVSFMRKES